MEVESEIIRVGLEVLGVIFLIFGGAKYKQLSTLFNLIADAIEKREDVKKEVQGQSKKLDKVLEKRGTAKQNHSS